jgi:AraC-like DNA-binding protein
MQAMAVESSSFDAVLTVTQALQLVGLVPCLFVVIFLLTLSFRNREALIPACYFATLACGFALPLMALYPQLQENNWLMGALLFGESTLVAFSFLLVLQFMIGRVPSWPYWLVLAIPIIGGGSLTYAMLMRYADLCLQQTNCIDVASIKTLYNIFASALVFLLLLYYSSRAGEQAADSVQRRHKYWLMIALILLNLLALALDLAEISKHLKHEEALFAATMLRLTFIYLAITSLFRVFYPGMVGEVIQLSEPAPAPHNPELDKPHVDKIKALMEEQRAYREMRLNRAALAKLVGISEHYLSRIINRYFGKNFNELINGYRIEEAKLRLKNEPGRQITVIGFEVGFNSIASFNRVFKEVVGVSPTEWREKGELRN